MVIPGRKRSLTLRQLGHGVTVRYQPGVNFYSPRILAATVHETVCRTNGWAP